MGLTISAKSLPQQKIPDSKKNETWGKDCVDACESLVLFQNEGLRQSRLNKKINYNLVAGVFDQRDMERVMNPYNLKNASFPLSPKNYPITNPKLQALKGEELKRRFDWKVSVVNEDAVSDIENQQKEYIQNVLVEIVQAEIQGKGLSEEAAQLKLAEAQKYVNFEMQDMRELTATRLLKYYTDYLNLKELFNRGWDDVMIAGEEIYAIDEVAAEPQIRKCNPMNTYFLTSPDNNYIDKCDIIVEEHYWPAGTVIDMFYEKLTPKDIDKLERRNNHIASDKTNLINYGPAPVFTSDPYTQDMINTDNLFLNQYGGDFDNNGNVRVVKSTWKSFRRIGILTYYNHETSEQLKKYVHEDYTPNHLEGESIKYIWISEYWEGWKLANEIYLGIQPKSIQFRNLNNISECSSGYVGTIYNTNSSKVQSLFDMMKPYQYLYNAYMYRTELAMIKSIGKIGVLDLSQIPDWMDTEMWIHYAMNMGWAVTDSFKEGKKGAAQGKLAGSMSGQAKEIDLDQSKYIQAQFQMLNYIESQLDKITGISQQRTGLVEASQGLGVTQQAAAASANITEALFFMHDQTKVRVYKTLLETVKYCFKDKGNVKIRYILDDMSAQVLNVDGELINECEYGLKISNAVNDLENIQMLKEATKIALQTGAVDIIQMMDVFSNDSTASIKRKLEKSIKEKQQQAAQAGQAEQQAEQTLKQMDIQLKQAELEQERYLKERELEIKQYDIDSRDQTKIQIAEISAYAFDEGPNTADISSAADTALKQQDILNKQYDSATKAMIEKNKLAQEKELKEKELSQKEKEMKSKEYIEELKAKTALQVAKENKTKAELSKSKSKK